MLKKMLMAMSLAAAAVIAGGCGSVKVADDFGKQKISENASEKNIAHICAHNWGIYAISTPLITGDPKKTGAAVFGEDTVNPKTTVQMVTRKSDELGATKTLDLDTKTESIWIFPLFIIFLEECSTSGNAVK